MEGWFVDPAGDGGSRRIEASSEEMLEAELNAALHRGANDRPGNHAWVEPPWAIAHVTGRQPVARDRYRRSRGRVLPGWMRTSEWRNQTIPDYRRLTSGPRR